MKMTFYITVLLLAISSQIFAQPECAVFFKFKGIIIVDSNKVSKIGLPTTPFLCGYLSKKDERAFVVCELKDSIISQVVPSHQSPEFCMEPVNIVRNIFSKNESGFLLKIYKKDGSGSKDDSSDEYLVPLSALKFSSGMLGNRVAIIIDLGRIQP